jgi:UTP:GlnB (protein PII) uridylyltransferase
MDTTTNDSIITGPRTLRERFEKVVDTLIKERRKRTQTKYLFKNLDDALENVRNNFSAIKELAGIYQLETTNEHHRENVSDHTLLVVENVKKTNYYKIADVDDKSILELSAYLHDIGKGPASKWRDGKQPAYPDHPADGAFMILRILREDIDTLDDYQIRMICLLVIYHDLIGEIIARERSKQQLLDIIDEAHELRMLAALNSADVQAIDEGWSWTYDANVNDLINEIIEEKELE